MSVCCFFFLLLYQQVISGWFDQQGTALSNSTPASALCCVSFPLWLVSTFYVHSTLRFTHFTLCGNFLFFVAGERNKFSKKCTVFAIIYVHLGLCTSQGITLRFLIVVKTVECDAVEAI